LNKRYLLLVLVMGLILASTSANALYVAFSDQGTDVVETATGTALALGNLTVQIWDASNGGTLIYNYTFTNKIINGSWNVMIGEETDFSLEYGKKYWKDYKINGEDMSFTNATGSTVNRTFWISPLGDIYSNAIARTLNTTTINYNGSCTYGVFTGYTACDMICDAFESGSSLCSPEDIQAVRRFNDNNVSLVTDWTAEAWINDWGQKYSPATVPMNDCNGHKWGAAGSYLGSWWRFNTTTGGDPKAGHCGNTFPLACCR